MNDFEPNGRDLGIAKSLLQSTLLEMGRQDLKFPWPRPEEHLLFPFPAECPADPGARRASIEAHRLALKSGANARIANDEGEQNWLSILMEEVHEVMVEDTSSRVGKSKRVDELIQVAAVALSWAQHICESVKQAEEQRAANQDANTQERGGHLVAGGDSIRWCDGKPEVGESSGSVSCGPCFSFGEKVGVRVGGGR